MEVEPGEAPDPVALPCLSAEGTQRHGRLQDARLLLVTDARLATDDLARFLDTVLAASVDGVRLRELELPAERFVPVARTAREVCDHHGALLLLDDRPEVALEVGADGVHVGRRGPRPAAVRVLTGPDLLLSRSTVDPRDLAASADEDLDHVTVPAGPAAGRVRGLAAVHAAAVASPHPWFAVGGIGPATIGRVLAAGARRVVVGAAMTRASDPAEVAWTLRRALGRHHT